MMRHEIVTFAFIAVMFLLLIWRIRGGYACGMMQELVNILSGAAAIICVALVYLAVRSGVNHATHTLAVCILALILLGVVFKVCRLILSPLLAVKDVVFLSGINKLLGAVLGAAEAGIVAYLLYKVMKYLGVSVF